ncbi:thermonuclease family protein [Microvirga alba]|uniref:Thermonuclease family protein n=1 Tax=Microvirga alba TaxID=2791025 RepID=A0A931BVS8_9HYPH|nr:thermonuclease family protein [Microvirga alba]MBF9235634.1 thermonuclease family protein [Microvirga alba]
MKNLQDLAPVIILIAGAGAAVALSASARFGAAAGPPGGPNTTLAEVAPKRGMFVRVIDGDTLEDPETRVVYRLSGADACEATQRAFLNGQPWPCGAVATAWLVEATLGKPVTCSAVTASPDRYRRILSRCSSPDHADLAADMIRAGIAVAYRFKDKPTDLVYARLEEVARGERRGLWQSQFVMPWIYRADNSKETNP